MAALAHGVPLVCLPQGREQGFNAARVEAMGAGVTLSIDATPGDIANAIGAVLADQERTAAAQSMAALIATCGRGDHALREVEAVMAGVMQPVTRSK